MHTLKDRYFTFTKNRLILPGFTKDALTMTNNTYELDFARIRFLKQNDAVWRLLSLDSSPLILSFCYSQFVLPNNRSISEQNLETALTDYLYQLRDQYGSDLYPRAASDYLQYWSSEANGFLRKYYPQYSEQAEYDLMPATEKAIEWLQSLQPKSFVGTESRMLVIFQLLRQIKQSTTTDPKERLKDLRAQRKAIDAEIAEVKQGIKPLFNETQIKERFYQVEDTARKLLSDFRQIDYNFRQLDRQTRELIAKSEQGKGALLDEVFQQQDIIQDSDQGRSFLAFWELLTSPARQQELTELLHYTYQLEPIKSSNPNAFLKKLYRLLAGAGEQVYKTHKTLASQLSTFIADQVFLENKRILSLIRKVEKKVLEAQDNPPPDKQFMHVTKQKASLSSLLSRTLHQTEHKQQLNSDTQQSDCSQIKLDALLNYHYIDEKLLRKQIDTALLHHSQISLKQLIDLFPLQKGISELVTYVKIATEQEFTVIDDAQLEFIQVNNRNVTIAKILFVRPT